MSFLMLEVFIIMATNKLLVAFGDEVTKVLGNLPKGTKSKFVNMCVEHVIGDPALRNKLIAQLLGFNDEAPTRPDISHEYDVKEKHEENSSDLVTEQMKRVPRTKLKF